jgi:multiple sugar transport system substrate-binding protein
MSIALKGMTWSHPRGVRPLLAAAEVLKTRGIDVQWDARSLQGFEEASIAELAERYDMIAIDHPFMGRAFEQGALARVDEIVGEAFVAELRASSVGPSFDSYIWNDALWAIPVDAAAQVAAYRHDLLAKHGLNAPRSWDDVFALIDALPPESVAMPANPTHLLLAFATICEAVSNVAGVQGDLRPNWWRDDGIERQTALDALAILRRFMARVHPMSWTSDPIEVFDRATSTDEIAYVPIAFGYSNYARAADVERPLHFTAVPSGDGDVGSGMLGGVGLCVSRRCQSPEAVAEVLRFVAGGATQTGLYLEAGGQPAHRDAWTSAATERVCPNFFGSTLPSLDRSFVRPRLAAYPGFQRDGGKLLYDLLRQPGMSDEAIIGAFDDMWRQRQTQSEL